MPDETTTEPCEGSEQNYYIIAVKDKGRPHFIVCERVISINLTDDAARNMMAAIERYIDENKVPAAPLPCGFLLSFARVGLSGGSQ